MSEMLRKFAFVSQPYIPIVNPVSEPINQSINHQSINQIIQLGQKEKNFDTIPVGPRIGSDKWRLWPKLWLEMEQERD